MKLNGRNLCAVITALVAVLAVAPGTEAAHHEGETRLPPSIDIGQRPESVTRGFDGDLFVTVMNDQEKGDGVVKRIHDGTVTVFATGLDEPKGIAFVGEYLVTTDLLRVWRIDANGKGEVIAEAKDFPEPILYLNDVAVMPDRSGVYVTDMGDKDSMWSSPGVFWPLGSDDAAKIEVVGRVYQVSLDGDVSLVVGPSRQMLCPNGVGVGRDGQLLVGAFFTGNLLAIQDGQIRVIADGFRGADAVEQDPAGNYYVSSWSQGKVWRVDPQGRTSVLLDGLQSAADFYLDPEERKLYVPDMKAGKLYTLTLNADVSTTSLFDGKSLDGWHVDVPAQDKEPASPNPFLVRDGLLVSLGTPKGHLITDAVYQDYRLEVEYRFAGKPGNCGVLVHASKPRALYGTFPQSIEVQMFHENAGDFWCIVEDIAVPDMEARRGPKEKWGITENMARRILNLTDGSEKPVGEWNTMMIECLDDSIKVWVNGDLVNHGFDCTASKGQIALQAEGSEVEFRRIELTPIEKDP